MLVVDSSVWIDFFNGVQNAQADELDWLLQSTDVDIVLPDLVLYEVMRGFRSERGRREAQQRMQACVVVPVGGADAVLRAAEHFRALRQLGATVRSSIDVLIATYCIDHGLDLLHRDRDYDAFVAHRGLKVWKHQARR